MMRDPAPHVVVANLSKEEARLLVRLLRERIAHWKASKKPESGRHLEDKALVDYLNMCIVFADGKK